MKKRILSLFTMVFLVCLMGITVSASSVTSGGKTVTTVTPGNTKQTVNFTYDNSSSSKLGNSVYIDSYTDFGVIIPIKVTSAGLLQIGANTTWTSNSDYISMEVFTDSACKNEYTDDIGSSFNGYLSNGYTSYSNDLYITKAGTYYLRVYTYVSSYYLDDYFKNTGSLSFRFVSSADRTLSNNTVVRSCGTSAGTYYKINVAKSGYITLTASQSDGYYLSTKLYNSSKKVIKNSDGNLYKSEGYKTTYKVSKGTYYVLVKGCTKQEYALKYNFTTGTTASLGKTVTVYPANSKQNIYVKVKATKTGYLTVNAVNSYGSITLCNSKYKAVSEKVSLYTGSTYSKKAVFGVQKGQTYYIKVNATGLTSFKCTISGVSEKSGSKSSKAVAIKKGGTAKGTIVAGSGTCDYYKITLSKAQKVKVTVKGNATSGTIRVAFYSNKKCTDKYYMGGTYIYGNNNTITLNSSSNNKNKWSKGTYYIKVYREDSLSNGNYSIKWN